MIVRVAFFAALFGMFNPTAALLGQVSNSPVIAGCEVFPSNNIWNVPVDSLPVDPQSTTYVNTIGRDRNLHPDFGSGLWPPETGGPIGIPFTTVPGSQERVSVSFRYVGESEPGPYPVPPDAPIEGGVNSTGDRHVLVLDTDNCILYELYKSFLQFDGKSWNADSGAVFDLGSNELRPDGWTSADAAGLPILPGLVRYEEVAAGEIRHAVRFTVPQTRKAYVWPARHFASNLNGSQYPPMGQRFRLKASFDMSGFDPQVQVILRALKTYGMILADNGSPWYISGVPDERWDNDILAQLKTLRGSDFEAVDVSSLQVSANSGATVLPELGTLLFPHLGNGAGGNLQLNSEIVLVNTGSNTEVTVEFFTSEGAPWNVDLGDEGIGSRFDFQLPRGQQIVTTTQGSDAFEVGYARVTAGPGVRGTAILRGADTANGVTLFEAGVPSADLHQDFSVVLDSEQFFDTGLALLYPPLGGTTDIAQTTSATAVMRLYDEAFNLVGETSLELSRGEYRPRFIHELFTDPETVEKAREMRGLLSIQSTQPLAALTLRQHKNPNLEFPLDVPTLTVFPVIPGRPEPSAAASEK